MKSLAFTFCLAQLLWCKTEIHSYVSSSLTCDNEEWHGWQPTILSKWRRPSEFTLQTCFTRLHQSVKRQYDERQRKGERWQGAPELWRPVMNEIALQVTINRIVWRSGCGDQDWGYFRHWPFTVGGTLLLLQFFFIFCGIEFHIWHQHMCKIYSQPIIISKKVLSN